MRRYLKPRFSRVEGFWVLRIGRFIGFGGSGCMEGLEVWDLISVGFGLGFGVSRFWVQCLEV